MRFHLTPLTAQKMLSAMGINLLAEIGGRLSYGKDWSRVRECVDALWEAVQKTKGPGQGVDIDLTDELSMHAVQRLLRDPRAGNQLDVMQFAGKMQLCWKTARAASMRVEEADFLRKHDILFDAHGDVVAKIR